MMAAGESFGAALDEALKKLALSPSSDNSLEGGKSSPASLVGPVLNGVKRMTQPDVAIGLDPTGGCPALN